MVGSSRMYLCSFSAIRHSALVLALLNSQTQSPSTSGLDAAPTAASWLHPTAHLETFDAPLDSLFHLKSN